MADNDQVLEAYVKRIMDVQYGMEQQKPLTDDELKEIALEMGLSEAEYENSKRQAETHHQRAMAFLKANNYADAIEEWTKAITLYPNHVEANHLLGKAYMHYAMLNESEEDMKQARFYTNRCLQLSPVHAGALKVKTQIRKGVTHRRKAEESEKRSKKMLLYIIIGAVVLALGIFHISVTNSMAGADEEVNKRWAQVENVYQRRADLIPNLISTVQAAADHEKEVLEAVTNARANAGKVTIDPASMTQDQLTAFQQNQSELGGALTRLLAVAESYPTLGSSENFLALQDELEGSENRISTERRNFNQAVQTYNAKARKFPYSIYGYEARPYFRMDSGADQVPDVSFD